MVDEEHYRRTYKEIITVPCPFEKALLQRACACPMASKTNIAEREAINCQSHEAQENCVDFLQFLRRRANFALGITHTPGALPHAKAIKIQCGGLLGLQKALDPIAEESKVSDVRGLLRRALKRFENLGDLPFDEIIRAVSQYQGRQIRAKRHKRGHP